MKKMKTITIVLLLFVSGFSSAQDLNVGLELCGGPNVNDRNIISLGPIIEYRPVASFVSLNSGLLFLLTKDKAILTIPLSLKFIIGDKIRFCPAIGGFYRTNNNYGWSTAIIIDYEIKKKLFLYVKGEYNRDYWKEEAPSQFGGTYEYTNNGASFWFGVGLKKNIL